MSYVDKGEIPRVEVYGFRPMSQNPNPNGGAEGVCPSIKIEYEIGTSANRPINGFPRERAPGLNLNTSALNSDREQWYLPTTSADVGSAAADGDAFVYYKISDKVAFSGEYFNFIESTIYPGGQRGWNGDYPGYQKDQSGKTTNIKPGWAKPEPNQNTDSPQAPPWDVRNADGGYFQDYISPVVTTPP